MVCCNTLISVCFLKGLNRLSVQLVAIDEQVPGWADHVIFLTVCGEQMGVFAARIYQEVVVKSEETTHWSQQTLTGASQ